MPSPGRDGVTLLTQHRVTTSDSTIMGRVPWYRSLTTRVWVASSLVLTRPLVLPARAFLSCRVMVPRSTSRGGGPRHRTMPRRSVEPDQPAVSPAVKMGNKRQSTQSRTTMSRRRKTGTDPSMEGTDHATRLDPPVLLHDKPWYTVFTKDDPLYNAYMATEWGWEVRGDAALLELLVLEGAQSGLSWRTILHKRHNYRQCFPFDDVGRMASMTQKDVETMLATPADKAVVRHRGKIEAAIHNARCVLELPRNEGEDGQVLDRFLWSFVQDRPILNGHEWNGRLQDLPATSDESIAMSRALKAKGFKFVGPTTCYALMQSAGMVIDHPKDTPEWKAAYERLKTRKGGFQDRSLS